MGRFNGFEGHFGCLQKKLVIIFFIKTLSERYPNVRYNVIITPFGALVHFEPCIRSCVSSRGTQFAISYAECSPLSASEVEDLS